MSKSKSVFEDAYFHPRHSRRVFWNSARDPVKIKFRSESAQESMNELAQIEMNARRSMNLMKWCGGKCKQILNTEECFYKDDTDPSGWRWECKDCTNNRRKTRRQQILALVWRRV